MVDDTFPSPGDSGTLSAQPPESFFWPLVALVLVILPQVLVPGRLREGPPLIVPVVEATVFVALLVVAAKPGPVPRAARPLILSLFALLILANSAAAVRLVVVVLRPPPTSGAPPSVTRLLMGAGIVLATNIVTFGLLYWQLDAGGPSARMVHSKLYFDFQFPQTGTEGLAPPDWQPRFQDHLYMAYTNVVAFSPTDTLPLTHRAKRLMTIQSMISLAVLVVVISRVINILPS